MSSDSSPARARRSPYWRPGMNPQTEPFVALAETNAGHLVVPCGSQVEHAREVVARWKLLTERGHGIGEGGSRQCYGAAVVDPRGEIHECWRRPGDGMVPSPGGPPRWTPLRRTQVWTTCWGCGERRWPGTWLTLTGEGCRQCQPAREADDPRPWPREHPPMSADPETVAEREERQRVRPQRIRAATRPFGAGTRRRPTGGMGNQAEAG